MSAPVIKWPGSKWNIASWIIAQMPRHDCYIEPFFGSGAVFFSKEPSNVEIINDMDRTVVGLFSMIRERPDDLAAAIALTPWSRDEYDDCRQNITADDNLEQARRLLVAMWQGIGVRRGCGDENRVAVNGWRSRNAIYQSPIATWKRLPERIQRAALRLLDAQIENRPALDIIERHNSSEVLIYVDPPYHFDTRERRLYAHEMDDEAHRDLLDALSAHTGSALLSGYSCALYEEKLRDWQRLEISVRAQNNAVRTETLWLNPVCAERIETEQKQQKFIFD